MDSGNFRFIKIPDTPWSETMLLNCCLKGFKEFIDRMTDEGCVAATLVASGLRKRR